MINDDEKIAVIDFPQMVSVSHRNAQMFFDQDIECIYKFFKKRYNLSSEKSEDQDGFESDGEENGRPSFLSVKRAAGFLDKELAASGFTRKEQVEMEKFIEEDVEEHNSSSDDDDSTSEQGCSQINDAVPVKIDSLIIADQEPADEPDFNLALSDSDGPGTFSKEHGASTSSSGENKLENPSSSSNGDAKEPLESEGKTLSQDDDNDDDLSEDPDDEDDAALARQLNKQRRKATAAAHGRRRPLSSRNAYNDKGKGTMNSKIQRQACKW